MSKLVLSGDTSGSVTLDAPAVSGTTILTLPTSSGTVTVAGVNSNIVSSTAQATTSGTSIDFTSIPSWVKRITVMFSGVSTNGSSVVQIQLGDSGGVETSGYSSISTYIALANNTTRGSTSSSGFPVTYVNSAAAVYNGVLTISLQGSNLWATSGHIYETSAGLHNIGGIKTLSNTLDRVRITTVNGTDTFDAGTINILYE